MMKMKDSDAFERSLKEALEAYEVPYNSADWAQLERQLDTGKPSTWQASAGLYALFLGGAIAVATTTYVVINDVPSGNNSPGEIAMVTPPVEDRNEVGSNTADLGPQFVNGNSPNEAATTQNEPFEPFANVENSRNGAVIKIESAIAATTPEPVKRSSAKEAATHTPGVKGPAQNNATGVPTTKSSPIAAKHVEDEETASTGVAIRPSVTEGCPGVTIEFSVDNMPEDGIHLWNFGDGSFSNKPNPSHTFSKAGTFEVMLSHSSIGGGNIRNKPASDRIIIHEAPEAAFHFRKTEYDNTVPSVRFDNRSIGGNKYHWDFGDGNTSTIAHPNHVFKKKGTYQITLTTTNAKGCIDRADRTIVVDEDYNLLAPRTFSPDNDGFEDSFIPEALKTLGVKFHMSVFDSTTGELMYETNDPQRPWNGRVQNKGSQCEPGEYVWLVEMKDGALLGGTYTGNVSLLR